MTWYVAIPAIVALTAIAVGAHLLLTWFERRGWVYYRSTHRPRPRSLGYLDEIHQPSSSHMIEEQISEETIADAADSGEPEE